LRIIQLIWVGKNSDSLNNDYIENLENNTLCKPGNVQDSLSNNDSNIPLIENTSDNFEFPISYKDTLFALTVKKNED